MNSKTPVLLCLMTLCFMCNCTTTKPVEDELPQDRVLYSPPANANEDVPSLPNTAPIIEQEPAATKNTSPANATGLGAMEISRNQLNVILSKGPSYPLQQAQVRGFKLKGRMVGFEIIKFTDRQTQQLLNPGLQVGDVITHLNGVSLILPKDYHAAWTRLKKADVIRVDYIRKNQTGFTTWTVK